MPLRIRPAARAIEIRGGHQHQHEAAGLEATIYMSGNAAAERDFRFVKPNPEAATVCLFCLDVPRQFSREFFVDRSV